jgi:CBS domain-containing protein
MIMSAVSIAARPLTLPSSTVGDLMTRGPFSFHKDFPIAKAATELSRQQLEEAPVVDDEGHLLGVVNVAACAAWMEFSARSAPRELSRGRFDLAPVSEIVNPNVTCAFARTRSHRVIEWFVENRSRRVYVVNARGKLVGVLSTADIFRRLSSNFHPL